VPADGGVPGAPGGGPVRGDGAPLGGGVVVAPPAGGGAAGVVVPCCAGVVVGCGPFIAPPGGPFCWFVGGGADGVVVGGAPVAGGVCVGAAVGGGATLDGGGSALGGVRVSAGGGGGAAGFGGGGGAAAGGGGGAAGRGGGGAAAGGGGGAAGLGGGGAAAGGGGGAVGLDGGGAAAGGGGGAAGFGGAAAGGGGGAGRAGGAAPGGPFCGGCLPFWSSGCPCACATTIEAVCACDGALANCIAVRAVVASSTRRRFVMMVSFPGRFCAPNGSAWAINSQPRGRIVAAPKRRKLFILTSQRLNCGAVHGSFRHCFQTEVPCCPLRCAASVAGLGVCGPLGPRRGTSSGSFPGSSSGRGGAPGSRTESEFRGWDCRAGFPAAAP
jgi:hypothetical protein